MTRFQHLAAPLSRLGAVAALAITPVAVMSADSATASIPSRPAAFHRASLHWVRLSPSPLGPRSQPILAWTGKELIELGGLRKGSTTNDGAAFDPATGRWHKIAPVRVNVGFDNATTAWTGRQLFVTNGQVASCVAGEPLSNCLARAGLYNPATNHWTTTLLPKAMEGMFPEASAWTGRDVVLAAVSENRGRLAVASYNPASRRWRVVTPQLPRRHPARFVALTAAPGRVLLWSAWSRIKPTSGAGVDVEAMTNDGRWHDVTGNWPQNHTLTAFADTRRGILVSPSQFWCGTACPGPFAAFPGSFANPVSLHRTAIPAGPLGPAIPAFTWTGRTIIAVNIGASVDGPGVRIRPDDMALYNPATKRWSRLAAAPSRPVLSVGLVWTGTQLLTLTNSGRLLAFRR